MFHTDTEPFIWANLPWESSNLPLELRWKMSHRNLLIESAVFVSVCMSVRFGGSEWINESQHISCPLEKWGHRPGHECVTPFYLKRRRVFHTWLVITLPYPSTPDPPLQSVFISAYWVTQVTDMITSHFPKLGKLLAVGIKLKCGWMVASQSH